MIDAATLYLTLTLANGEPSTSTHGFESLQACEDAMKALRALDRTDHSWPGVSYRCEEHKPIVGLTICRPHHRQCDDYTMPTRRGCEALLWVTLMRDRRLMGGCFPEEAEPPPRSE